MLRSTLFVLIYSVSIRFVLIPLLNLLAVFSDRIQKQLRSRPEIETDVFRIDLARKRRLYKKCVVFFCSSAGEYEQAKPIISRLQGRGVFTHTFFFSRSGFDFAIARNETSSFSLTPIDIVWVWGGLFASLQPEYVVIVRHEFWPSFLLMARRWSQIVVLNGVPPSRIGREFVLKTTMSSMIKKFLLGPNAQIFTADEVGSNYFHKNLKFPLNQISKIGDTKFDRVVERISAMKGSALKSAFALRDVWKSKRYGEVKLPVLLIGSAHLADLKFLLAALATKGAPKMRLMIVPHELNSKNLSAMETIIREHDLTYEWMSDVEVLLIDGAEVLCDIIIVDSMGRLSELYAAGDLAWIGGAVHSKIHNVLEPAAWGVPLTCGPHFQNSQEAISLIKSGLMIAPETPDEAATTWHRQLQGRTVWRQKLMSELEKLTGASDKFVAALNLEG